MDAEWMAEAKRARDEGLSGKDLLDYMAEYGRMRKRSSPNFALPYGMYSETDSKMKSVLDQLHKWKQSMESIKSQQEKIEKKKAEDIKYRKITEPVNIFVFPLIQCPECMTTYVSKLLDDGIRISLRHDASECSNSLTEIIRPKAAFMREI